MRFAVRDAHSDALGSAGQFVDVPDVHGGSFALSSVVLGAEEVPDSVSGNKASVDADFGPAVRQFSPGDELLFSYEIYNAYGPMVRATVSIWRDGRQIFVRPTDSLRAGSKDQPRRAIGSIELDSGITPGEYVLQVDALDVGLYEPTSATSKVNFQVK
jgi:hypothetical protein